MRDFAPLLDFSHQSQMIGCAEGWHRHRLWARVSSTCESPPGAQVGGKLFPGWSHWKLLPMLHTGSGLASQGAPAAPPSKLSSEISSLRAALSCFCGQVEFVWVRWASSQLLIFTKSASIPSVSWGCPGALSCLSCFTEGSFERGHQGKGCLKSCALLWSMSSSRQEQSTYGSWGKAGRW